jgi:hypothetical protein
MYATGERGMACAALVWKVVSQKLSPKRRLHPTPKKRMTPTKVAKYELWAAKKPTHTTKKRSSPKKQSAMAKVPKQLVKFHQTNTQGPSVEMVV